MKLARVFLLICTLYLSARELRADDLLSPPNGMTEVPAREIEDFLEDGRSGNDAKAEKLVAELWEAEMCSVYVRLAARLDPVDRRLLAEEQADWWTDRSRSVRESGRTDGAKAGRFDLIYLTKERVADLRSRLEPMERKN